MVASLSSSPPCNHLDDLGSVRSADQRGPATPDYSAVLIACHPEYVQIVQDAEINRILREIGRRIQTRRAAAGLTQEAAAAKAGIDYKRWQKLEMGEVNATVRTLVRVAGAVGESLWDLLAKADSSRGTRRRGR